jgi:hypothetical protein
VCLKSPLFAIVWNNFARVKSLWNMWIGDANIRIVVKVHQKKQIYPKWNTFVHIKILHISTSTSQVMFDWSNLIFCSLDSIHNSKTHIFNFDLWLKSSWKWFLHNFNGTWHVIANVI